MREGGQKESQEDRRQVPGKHGDQVSGPGLWDFPGTVGDQNRTPDPSEPAGIRQKAKMRTQSWNGKKAEPFS